MTTISIYIDTETPTWYCSDCVLVYVSGPTTLNCISYKNTEFKYVTHTIWTSLSYNLEFLIPSSEKDCYKQIKLFKNGSTQEETIKFENDEKGESCYKDVYVYFYGKDPRPLLFCYGDAAYIPSGKEKYDEVWVKATGISKCVCEGTVECTSDNSNCCKLLKALVKVVGFLNEVDLSKHPKSKDNGTCISSTSTGSVASEVNTCKATEKANSCTYKVHKYNNQEIKVKVTCAPVPSTPPSPNGSCYKKLTHQPIGMCEDGVASTNNGEGFRLGNVMYKDNGGGEKGKIQYYPNGVVNGTGTTSNRSNHWRQPLLKVTAYFYDGDTKYLDPLLVVLEFKNNGADATDKEYYKLTKTVTASGKMEWTRDTETAKSKVGSGKEKCLVEYLDKLRYDLKKVIQIKLDQNTSGSYPLRGRDGSKRAGGMNAFGPIPRAGDKTITVEDCKDGMCSELNKRNYKCYQHKISNIEGFDYNLIAGVAFTIPRSNGESDKVIQLYNNTGDTEDFESLCESTDEVTPLTYNKCMGDVYVFFYGKGVEQSKPDSVPLMLWYNKDYYAPCNREEYFTRWDKVSGLSGKPCEGGEVNGLVEKLSEQLDIVNKSLNQIDLDNPKVQTLSAGSGTAKSGYGLPETGEGGIRPSSEFPTMRVSLKKQEGPSQPPQPGSHAYVKVVHRTYNGFQIGEIMYGKQNFATQGIKINGASGSGGDVKIGVKSESNGDQTHTKLVSTNKWNTVVVYYSIGDKKYQLPQLIVILKTSEPIKDGETVTGSTTEPAYGYYILTNKNGAAGTGVDYEYVWHPVENGPEPKTPVTLDNETDFRLLNSVVILVDKRCNGEGTSTNYGDGQISSAIKSAGLKSPGQDPGSINRITGKDITVKDETSGTCLSGTGFKAITHDIDKLVTPSESLRGKLLDVTLIAGLRFLIPTGEEGKYRQLTLYDGSDTRYLYYQKSNNTLSVFFYERDPRPLLLCYGESSYRPKYMITYFNWWDKDTNIKNCDCKQQCKELLTELVNVSNFLNPLNIKKVTNNNEKPICYCVHWFNGNLIKIKVEFTPPKDNSFCYNRYTHTPEKPGFRLGTIYYGCNCIRLNGTGGTNGTCITSELKNGEKTNNYKSAEKVVVFYYQGDTGFERPLLVALCKNNSETCNLFYELQNDVDKSGAKKYKKGTNSIKLEDKANSELEKKLDKIRYDIAIKLQIIIDKRPTATRYCLSKPDEKTCPPDKSKKDSKCDEDDKALHDAQCKIINGLKGNGKNNPGCVLLSAGKSLCYQAQLYNEKGQPVPNGSKSEVKVAQVKCPQLTTYGYKCYEHQITTLDKVEQIGGLKFFLWDNTGKGQGGQGCTTTTTSGSAICPSASGGDTTCKELCLYKDSSTSGQKEASSVSCTAAADSSQPSKSNCGATAQSSQLKPVTTSYTTCKGNVYVYFYGDDPRPLLMCYDNNAYGPRCREDYECRWVYVPGVTGCGVVKEGKKLVCKSLATVLCHLYKTSMFLNPVQLGRTRCALKAQPQTPYKYSIHQFNTTCVKIAVSPTDLSCYRRYVHAPMAGYRLGKVTYNPSDEKAKCNSKAKSAKCPQAPVTATCQAPAAPQTGTPFCFPYTTSKQLIGVGLYYYMYDKPHKYPLIVELQFKGEVSDYYRLNCKDEKKWVLMTDKPGEGHSSKNGLSTTDNDACKDQGSTSCQNAVQTDQTCAPAPTDKETCDLDAEFARRAREIEEQILALNMASEVDQVDFMALTAELLLLIERRAYEIRKSLGLPFQKESGGKSNLIMATHKNCHEDSVLMYLVGGGAVGVAGGGCAWW